MVARLLTLGAVIAAAGDSTAKITSAIIQLDTNSWTTAGIVGAAMPDDGIRAEFMEVGFSAYLWDKLTSEKAPKALFDKPQVTGSSLVEDLVDAHVFDDVLVRNGTATDFLTSMKLEDAVDNELITDINFANVAMWLNDRGLVAASMAKLIEKYMIHYSAVSAQQTPTSASSSNLLAASYKYLAARYLDKRINQLKLAPEKKLAYVYKSENITMGTEEAGELVKLGEMLSGLDSWSLWDILWSKDTAIQFDARTNFLPAMKALKMNAMLSTGSKQTLDVCAPKCSKDAPASLWSVYNDEEWYAVPVASVPADGTAAPAKNALVQTYTHLKQVTSGIKRQTKSLKHANSDDCLASLEAWLDCISGDFANAASGGHIIHQL